MALKNNTWKLNQWYDQSVAGNVSYTGPKLLWGYGSNSYGGLAQNSTSVATYSSPIQISDATTWNFPPSGASHSAQSLIMTKTDGTLWSWGYNYYSILGQNSPANARLSSPTQIGGDTTWASAVMGRNNAFATKTDGTLWTWGNNYRGVFGTNQAHNTQVSSPVQVPGTTWDKIYSFNIYTAAIKTDGTLWIWGSNSQGVLGQSQTINQAHRSSPTQIPGTTWAHVASGSENKIHATKTDGSLWGWGLSYYGELGNNNTTSYSSPVQVGSDTTWSLGDYKISNGDYVTHAIKTDGTLWAWGLNQYGQLGQNQDGIPTSLSSPTQVGSDTTWSTVSASYTHAVSATKTDGTLWQWALNFPNQGGAVAWDTGTATGRSSPVQLPGTWGKVLVTRRNLLTQKVF